MANLDADPEAERKPVQSCNARARERTVSRRTKLALLVGSTLFSLVLLDVGVRLFVKEDRNVWIENLETLQCYHPFLGLARRPGGARTLTDEYGTRQFSTNSLGLRGGDLRGEKAPNSFRIVCVGGSTTESPYASDDSTYPALLEAELRARVPKKHIEVVNAGVSTYTSGQCLINFALNLLELSPDLVVFYQGINDLAPIMCPGFQPDYSHFCGPYYLKRLTKTAI